MNRNPDGSPVTNDQMAALLTDHQVSKIKSIHGSNAQRSGFVNATAQARFDLMCDGQLLLDTRTPANSDPDFLKPTAFPEVDPDTYAYLKARKRA